MRLSVSASCLSLLAGAHCGSITSYPEVIFRRQKNFSESAELVGRPQPAVFARLWGKFGGPCACGGTASYFIPLPSLLSKSFVFKTVVAKEGLPRDDPSGPRGAGGPEFKSRRPDQNIFNEVLGLCDSHCTRKISLRSSRDRRSHSVSCSMQRC